MLIAAVGFGDERRCHEAIMVDGDGVRRKVCSGMKESAVLDSPDCEDSIDIVRIRGDRGNANLMEVKRLPFDLSSLDFFENAEDGGDDVGLLDDDDVPVNNEKA